VYREHHNERRAHSALGYRERLRSSRPRRAQRRESRRYGAYKGATIGNHTLIVVGTEIGGRSQANVAYPNTYFPLIVKPYLCVQGYFVRVGAGVQPFHRTTSLVNFSKRSDVELHPDEGGGIEEKPHRGVQASVLPAGRNRQNERPAQICREHNLAEGLLSRWRKEYDARGETAFTDEQLSESGALEARIAELERFCGKLALENEILKKGLSPGTTRKEAPHDRRGHPGAPRGRALSTLCELCSG
jgi:transposase